MSDVKRVTLTTISDVVRKGAGAGASIGGPFGALDGANAMSSALGGGGAAFAAGGSHSPAVKESSAGGSGGAGPEGGKSGSAKKHKTVRLELNLFEPTAESFPEFNFSKLVHEEQKRLKKAQKKHHDDSNNGFLSDPELDNDVARMARELERKYGSGTAYASKDKYARPAKLDYYDRGAGYDEEDSFIDNSEAYDELIPQEIETVGGGFYINSGQLEFKQLSNFERPDDVHRMPKPKKRALSTTSESSDDDEPPANAKKKAEERGQPPVAPPSQTPALSSSEKTASTNTEKPLHQQQLTEEERANSAGNSGTEVVTITTTSGDERPRVNGHVAKKQKLADNGLLGAPKGGVEKDKAKSSTGSKTTMEEPGKEKSNGVKAKVSTTNTQPTVAGAGPTVALSTGGGKKDENENDGGVKLIKTTTVKDMLRAKRDSLRKMEQEKKGRSSGSSRVSSSEAEEDGDGGGDEDDEDEENDEDDDEDEEEDDEDEEMGEGSEKESNESGSEEDIGSESESSHAESASEKDAAARAKLVPATNGTGGEGERPVTVVPTEQQQLQKDKEKERKRKESKLPDELPESLRKVVETLKELAQTHAIGGKLNYFDSKVAEVLLQVDEGARAAGNSTRNAIFRHLEAQLSISRQSLQLKIKKIRIRKLEGRAKAVLDQLEDTICDQMPLLLAKHELDCRKVAEQRAAQAAAAAQAAGTNVLPLGSTDPTTANGEKPGPQTTNATSTASTPQIRNPKKKYSWNERTRDLLWELYSIRVESFALVRPRNETEDDFVAEYLRNKVVPLWPKGWMRYEDLHKELDRRKKALAKSAPAAAAAAAVLAAAVPKKHPMVVLPPLTSPSSSAVDSTWMIASGTPTTTAMNGSTKPSGSPSVIGGAGKCAGSPGATAGGTPLTPQVPPSNLSPNGVSNKRGGSSDHSISNIMNSPPLPPPAGEKHSAANRSQSTGRRSFDDDQLMLSPPNPAGGSLMERDGSSAKRGGLLVSPPDHRTGSLPVADRQRWNSREDDSDSSIEIIGEYNVIGGGAGSGGHGPTASAGVIHSAKSIIPATPPTPASTTNVLPVLNKEKYKNLIAGKNKGHGNGGGSSPVGSADTSPTGGALIGPGKYSKHSPTVAGERMMTPQQGTGGGSLFSTPSGGSTGGTGGGGGGGGGGIRLSDVSRMKESPSTSSSIDLDVHQIMKDLKEYQELQQHHSAGGSRKADATTIPSQQQHDSVTDFLIGCDLDEDDFLFATNSYTYDGRNN